LFLRVVFRPPSLVRPLSKPAVDDRCQVNLPLLSGRMNGAAQCLLDLQR
jgi:hypothetical protein